MADHWILIIFAISYVSLAFITAKIEIYFDNRKKKKNDRIQTHHVRFRNNGEQK